MLEDFEPRERDENREQRGDRDVPEAAEHRRARGLPCRPLARARQRRERHPMIRSERVQSADGRSREHERATSRDHDDAAPACANRAYARGVLRTSTFILANWSALSGSAPAASQNSAAWSAKASG